MGGRLIQIPAWQRRRRQFYHDWLKNRYITSAHRFINLLDDLLEDEECERTYVRETLPEWVLHRESAVALCEEYELDMSPRTLFALFPLSQCSGETHQWLPDVVHSLWLARCPVRSWVESTLAQIAEVNRVYDGLLQTLEACEDLCSAAALRQFRSNFDELRLACIALSRAFEQFPREIGIV